MRELEERERDQAGQAEFRMSLEDQIQILHMVCGTCNSNRSAALSAPSTPGPLLSSLSAYFFVVSFQHLICYFSHLSYSLFSCCNLLLLQHSQHFPVSTVCTVHDFLVMPLYAELSIQSTPSVIPCRWTLFVMTWFQVPVLVFSFLVTWYSTILDSQYYCSTNLDSSLFRCQPRLLSASGTLQTHLLLVLPAAAWENSSFLEGNISMGFGSGHWP